MIPVEFEPKIPTNDRPQTQALDITANGIDYFRVRPLNIKWKGISLRNA